MEARFVCISKTTLGERGAAGQAKRERFVRRKGSGWHSRPASGAIQSRSPCGAKRGALVGRCRANTPRDVIQRWAIVSGWHDRAPDTNPLRPWHIYRVPAWAIWAVRPCLTKCPSNAIQSARLGRVRSDHAIQSHTEPARSRAPPQQTTQIPR